MKCSKGKRPPPYDFGVTATGGSAWQQISLVYAVFATWPFATDSLVASAGLQGSIVWLAGRGSRRRVRRDSASRALVAASWSPRVRLEEPGLVREHDSLDGVTEVELLEDVGEVRLDGGVADVELLRDFWGREAVPSTTLQRAEALPLLLVPASQVSGRSRRENPWSVPGSTGAGRWGRCSEGVAAASAP